MRDLTQPTLPNGPGVGYKPQHFTDIIGGDTPVDWLEIHAENYMGDGGRPLAQLRHLAERFPISVHGVGLSIGGSSPAGRRPSGPAEDAVRLAEPGELFRASRLVHP